MIVDRSGLKLEKLLSEGIECFVRQSHWVLEGHSASVWYSRSLVGCRSHGYLVLSWGLIPAPSTLIWLARSCGLIKKSVVGGTERSHGVKPYYWMLLKVAWILRCCRWKVLSGVLPGVGRSKGHSRAVLLSALALNSGPLSSRGWYSSYTHVSFAPRGFHTMASFS